MFDWSQRRHFLFHICFAHCEVTIYNGTSVTGGRQSSEQSLWRSWSYACVAAGTCSVDSKRLQFFVEVVKYDLNTLFSKIERCQEFRVTGSKLEWETGSGPNEFRLLSLCSFFVYFHCCRDLLPCCSGVLVEGEVFGQVKDSIYRFDDQVVPLSLAVLHEVSSYSNHLFTLSDWMAFWRWTHLLRVYPGFCSSFSVPMCAVAVVSLCLCNTGL